MSPIIVPTNKEEFEDLHNEWEAAYRFATGSDDKDTVDRAWKRIAECEKAFDECKFTMDDEGNFVEKQP